MILSKSFPWDIWFDILESLRAQIKEMFLL